ncbi:hypothetical protein FI667_g6940, partial [Globisporangium splendens]
MRKRAELRVCACGYVRWLQLRREDSSALKIRSREQQCGIESMWRQANLLESHATGSSSGLFAFLSSTAFRAHVCLFAALVLLLVDAVGCDAETCGRDSCAVLQARVARILVLVRLDDAVRCIHGREEPEPVMRLAERRPFGLRLDELGREPLAVAATAKNGVDDTVFARLVLEHRTGAFVRMQMTREQKIDMVLEQGALHGFLLEHVRLHALMRCVAVVPRTVH